MRFRISQSVTNGIELLHLVDDAAGVTVSIAPAHGAMLHAFILPFPAGPQNIILNYTDEQDIQEHLAQSFRSSKLSPFACRIRAARYQWQGESYEFSHQFQDGTAIHGLLYNKSFAVTEQVVTDFMASASFQYHYEADDAGYPFNYTCTVTYSLLPGQVLQLQTTLENQGSTTIPMVDGWHPYFRLGGKVDDCLLAFSSTGMLEFDDKLLPTGKTIPFNSIRPQEPLGSLELDNCFVLDASAGQPVCTFSDPASGAAVRFHTDGNYPYLQLYIPPDRMSIAIENLSGAPDAFNNGIGLMRLEPGSSQTLTLHYEVTLNQVLL